MEEKLDTLFVDCDSAGHPTNLIMHTEHPMAWYDATLQHYPSAKKSGNRATMGLKIGTEENQMTVTTNFEKDREGCQKYFLKLPLATPGR